MHPCRAQWFLVGRGCTRRRDAHSRRRHAASDHADKVAGGTYPGIDAETATVSVTALWIVNAAAPEDLIYAITKALWQDQTRRLLDFASPVGKRIRIATALTEPGVPLHPGAARYYRERGMELPPMER